MLIRKRPPWHLPEQIATPESTYLDRRSFFASLGTTALLACGKPTIPTALAATIPKPLPPYPLRRNPRYALDRPLTDEAIAASTNNFYEFTNIKDGVWKRVSSFRTDPWSVEVTGLVAKPRTWSLEELLKTMPMEERLYRHRCVEAWAMAVPWTGFPLAALLARAEPKGNARYVRFISFSDAEKMPGVKEQSWYPWPYYEGLRIDEAMHELTFAVTGVYGHALPRQHGAPLRLAVPWKYGYKSAKSIVRIELVEKEPPTFWQDLAPNEYPFESNVNPAVPHPRWSQASERLIGTFDVRRTTRYNGYGAFVKHLYEA